LPVDAKYKLYDERNIATSDIYQTFLYAFAYGEEHPVQPTALVLYPASSSAGTAHRLHVQRKGGAIGAELLITPIHIPTVLTEARTRKPGTMAKTLMSLVHSQLTSGPAPT